MSSVDFVRVGHATTVLACAGCWLLGSGACSLLTEMSGLSGGADAGAASAVDAALPSSDSGDAEVVEASFFEGSADVTSADPLAEAATSDTDGSPGAGEDDGSSIIDAADADCSSCALVIEYATPTTEATTSDIRPHVKILNNGTDAQDLTTLTLRYWFNADGSQSQTFVCDYVTPPLQCSSLEATFVALSSPASAADHYMELGFTGGSIPAGGGTGGMEPRFHDTSYAVTFTQTDDYSFNAADTTYTVWGQITLYREGVLVWGVEPN